MLTMKDVIREGDPILRNVAEDVSLNEAKRYNYPKRND